MKKPYQVQCLQGSTWLQAINGAAGGIGEYDSLQEAQRAKEAKQRYWPATEFRIVQTSTTIEETNMHLNQPLNVKTTTLISKIEAHEDARREAHEAEQQEERNRQSVRVSAFVMLMTSAPEWTTANIKAEQSAVINSKIDQIIAAGDDLKTVENVLRDAVQSHKVGRDFTPDKDAEKLLSVLRAAEDKTVQVTADSDLYRYL